MHSSPLEEAQHFHQWPRAAECTRFSKEATGENLGAPLTAGWEPDTHARIARPRLSQKDPSACRGLKTGGSAKLLDAANGWLSMLASSPTAVAK